MDGKRRILESDWYLGEIPENVTVDPAAYLETTYSFLHFRSQRSDAVHIQEGATVYMGTMFDLGPAARVKIGPYALVHGAWMICDAAIEIGEYALISWNVVLMDSYRASEDPELRRNQLKNVPTHPHRRLLGEAEARPIRIGRNAWIGFDACVLPGVVIGEGSIVGARSVVTQNVPPFTVVAGNPAKVIRPIENDENL